MRLIDADALCAGRGNDDPVVIAAKCAKTIEVEQIAEYRNLQSQAAAKEIGYLKEMIKLMDAVKEAQSITTSALQYNSRANYITEREYVKENQSTP